MSITIDKYLSTLLTYAQGAQKGRKSQGDYVSLIHVPVEGPECVYSVSYKGDCPTLTRARYEEVVWEKVGNLKDRESDLRPSVDVLRASVDSDHPVFEFLGEERLLQCENCSDGQPGLDYFLLMWRRGEESGVSECWEPYGRQDLSWMTVIGAIQTLSSQFEYALLEADKECVES